MEKLLLLFLLLLVFSASCFSAGEKDRGLHVGHAERKPSRAEPNQGGRGPCLCPDSQRPQKLEKHRHICPCDGFLVPQSGRHRRHFHRKSKSHPTNRKHKCRKFQTKCQHQQLMRGLQIPL